MINIGLGDANGAAMAIANAGLLGWNLVFTGR